MCSSFVHNESEKAPTMLANIRCATAQLELHTKLEERRPNQVDYLCSRLCDEFGRSSLALFGALGRVAGANSNALVVGQLALFGGRWLTTAPGSSAGWSSVSASAQEREREAEGVGTLDGQDTRGQCQSDQSLPYSPYSVSSESSSERERERAPIGCDLHFRQSNLNLPPDLKIKTNLRTNSAPLITSSAFQLCLLEQSARSFERAPKGTRESKRASERLTGAFYSIAIRDRPLH